VVKSLDKLLQLFWHKWIQWLDYCCILLWWQIDCVFLSLVWCDWDKLSHCFESCWCHWEFVIEVLTNPVSGFGHECLKFECIISIKLWNKPQIVFVEIFINPSHWVMFVRIVTSCPMLVGWVSLLIVSVLLCSK